MNSKRSFPDDWSNLTDEQVLENVEYLLNNLDKYTLTYPDPNFLNSLHKALRIDNVYIKPSDFVVGCFVINKKNIKFDNSVFSGLYHKVLNLYGMGRTYKSRRKKQIVSHVIDAFVFMSVFALSFTIGMYFNNRYKQQADQIKQISNQLDSLKSKDKAKEYDATKLFNAKDSLQKVR